MDDNIAPPSTFAAASSAAAAPAPGGSGSTPGGDAPNQDSAKSAKSRTKQCRCSKCALLPEGFRWLPTSTASDHLSRDKAKGLAGGLGGPTTPTPAKAAKAAGTGRKRGRPSNASIAAAAAAAAAESMGGSSGSPYGMGGMGVFSINDPIASGSGSGSGSGMGMGLGGGSGNGMAVAVAVGGQGSGSGSTTSHLVPFVENTGPYQPVWTVPPPVLRKSLRFPSRIVGQTGASHDNPKAPFRPYITLTWAQSLDAKIAGQGGARVQLSGKESMELTHWMRAMHHAIVIGVGTLLLDNPRLQVNLLPPAAHLSPPLIYILDPHLRTPTTARIMTEWTSNMNTPNQIVAARPTILCGAHMVWTARYRELEAAGAAIFGMQLDMNGCIPPQGLVNIFTSLGVRSAMIEGGSRVLSSFLHAGLREDGSKMVDSVVVTVAPTFIGDGVGVVPLGADVGLPPLKQTHTVAVGKDTVMFCTT